jgi:hypothetical protein
MKEEILIQGYRSAYPNQCVNCLFCRFELTEEERFDGKIKQMKDGRCHRYPPIYHGYPVVYVLDGWCGEHHKVVG